MRFAFAGTAPFAELVLTGLAAAGRTPAVLVTNPDRPRGRHGTPQAPPIKALAAGLGVPVLQPERLSDPVWLRQLLDSRADAFVVCAYGQIVKQEVLDAVETIVVHPSLVPHWRGAAPVERALMAGETELGVCTLRMTAGVDEGPIGDARTVHVPRDADAGRAYELLAPAAVAGVTATLDAMAAGTIEWRPQEGEATYARQDRARPTRRSTGAGRPFRSPIRSGRFRRTSAPSPSSRGAARASGGPRPARGRSRPSPLTGSSWPPETAGWTCWSCSKKAGRG